MYIIEGQCEVRYRTAPQPGTSPQQPAAAAPQPSPQQPAAEVPQPPLQRPAADAASQEAAEKQQQEQQPAAAALSQEAAAAEQQQAQKQQSQQQGCASVGATTHQRSAAGLYASSLDGGPGSGISRLGSTAADELADSGSSRVGEAGETGAQQGNGHTQAAAALFARANSSFIAEEAAAAALDMARSGGGDDGEQPPVQQAQRAQPEQGQGPPLAAQRPRPSRLSMPPIEEPSGQSLGEEALAESAGSASSPAALRPSAQSVAPTPSACSLAPTPVRALSVDIEGASAHLQSPMPERAVPTARPGSSSATPLANAGAEEQAQQAQQQTPSPPEAAAEELPPALLDVSASVPACLPANHAVVWAAHAAPTPRVPPPRHRPQAPARAHERLAGLRRGPREYLAAVRGPGDFIGEMEVLSECALGPAAAN